MARYIDADVLINEWNEKAAKMSRDRDGAIPVDFSLVISAVSKAPTLTLDDLRPKGRWEVIEDYVSSLGYTVIDGYRCSLCKEESREALDFCGHCGADMRGGDK